MPTLTLASRSAPPAWALRQRHLMSVMDRAAFDFVEKYTRPDGTLVWREEWPGMDGSADGYPTTAAGLPDFARMTPDQRLAYHRRRLDGVFA